METLVIDASIAIKWVVEEDGTEAALDLRSRFRFRAPELLIAECANILWKKVQRGELSAKEGALAGRLLEGSGIEIVSMRGMLEKATELAVRLAHPAYDCVYLVVAQQAGIRFLTADQRLLNAVSERGSRDLVRHCTSLAALGSNRP